MVEQVGGLGRDALGALRRFQGGAQLAGLLAHLRARQRGVPQQPLRPRRLAAFMRVMTSSQVCFWEASVMRDNPRSDGQTTAES